VYTARYVLLSQILDNLQHASRAEASERLGLLVLLAILGEVKSISEEVLHWAGQ